LPIGLEIKLQERQNDRVLVSLRLAPGADGSADIDGAALELMAPSGEEVCPRILLPIRGCLTSPVTTTIELRANMTLPPGCRVIATAWLEQEVIQATCPADPFTNLHDHVRGSRIGLPDPLDVELDVPTPQEVRALASAMPWTQQALRAAQPTTVIEMQPDRDLDDMAQDLGLDEEGAAWLKDLMDEPNP
jgi:hypothetical protein